MQETLKKWGYHPIPHRIHVWYIYLHLVDFYGKCRQIYHTWILWVLIPGFWARLIKSDGHFPAQEAKPWIWGKWPTFIPDRWVGHSNFERVMNHHPKKVMFSQNCQEIALYFPERLVFLYSPCVMTGGFWNHEVVCEISKTCGFSFQVGESHPRLVNPISGWWIPSQVGESHPYRHPSLPREKKVWLDPSNTVHLRRYDGMCRE